MCTENPEEWASHSMGGKNILKEVSSEMNEGGGVSQATEGVGGDVPARKNTTQSQTANSSIRQKV